jgi:hypothetical protein
MKFILLLCATFLSLSTNAQVQGVRDIIKDPTVSKRCKALINERNEKIQTKQKINSLLQRNNKLLKQANKKKKLALKRLELTKSSLKNNLRLTRYRIKAMEENIVRKGCPGISI